jgi:dynein heavy chain
VSSKLLGDCADLAALDPAQRSALQRLTAAVHTRVTAACQQYYLQYRRHAHVTPKSYIASVEGFKQLYRSDNSAPAPMLHRLAVRALRACPPPAARPHLPPSPPPSPSPSPSSRKLAQLRSKASAIAAGLDKMNAAKRDVGRMEVELAAKTAELAVAGAEAGRLLAEISASTAAAERERAKVAVIVEAVRKKVRCRAEQSHADCGG